MEIPAHVAGVPDELLIPRNTWEDKQAYDETARNLAKKFHDNFKKFTHVSPEIAAAGPNFK